METPRAEGEVFNVDVIRRCRIEEVIIADPVHSRRLIRHMVAACNGRGVQVKTMEFLLRPGVADA
jgi:ribosomal protein L7Ae-like RNA K-turn-binding protein